MNARNKKTRSNNRLRNGKTTDQREDQRCGSPKESRMRNRSQGTDSKHGNKMEVSQDQHYTAQNNTTKRETQNNKVRVQDKSTRGFNQERLDQKVIEFRYDIFGIRVYKRRHKTSSIKSLRRESILSQYEINETTRRTIEERNICIKNCFTQKSKKIIKNTRKQT